MRKYFFIGIGGFFGAVARYLMRLIQIKGVPGLFPIDTLMINISGSLILSFLLTLSFEVIEVDPDVRLGIATGFLGAFTTFSTLCKETVSLLQAGSYLSAISYIAASVSLGLGAAGLGTVLARKTGLRVLKVKKAKEIDAETESDVD